MDGLLCLHGCNWNLGWDTVNPTPTPEHRWSTHPVMRRRRRRGGGAAGVLVFLQVAVVGRVAFQGQRRRDLRRTVLLQTCGVDRAPSSGRRQNCSQGRMGKNYNDGGCVSYWKYTTNTQRPQKSDGHGGFCLPRSRLTYLLHRNVMIEFNHSFCPFNFVSFNCEDILCYFITGSNNK